MTLEIKKKDGRWLVNNDHPKNLNPSESKALDLLIIGARLESLNIKEKPVSNVDWEKILTEKN